MVLPGKVLRSRLFFVVVVLAVLLGIGGRARAQMSESEKKSAARAAFLEGVQLQDAGKAPEALAKFETAQKLFDAPTHQLHIAECQALTGKLLESAETYEALVHKNLGASPPEAFQQAQDQAKAELPGVRARIPNLRVTVKPEPSTLQNLQVTVNGVLVPNELLGLARPVNPGPYKINAGATNYKLAQPVELTIGERDAKNDPQKVDLTLQPGATQAIVVVPPPPPPPPYDSNAPPASSEQKPPPPPSEGSSPTGILAGVRGGAVIPGGGVRKDPTNTSQDISFDQVATTGGGVGLDLMVRFVRFLFVGVTLEYAALSGPSNLASFLSNGKTGETKQHTFYPGLTFGVIPNIDKISFLGEVGVGLRTLSRSVTANGITADESVSGPEFELGAGVSIPAGKLRIVPKAALNIGSFNNATSDCVAKLGANGSNVFTGCTRDGPITDTSTHTFFWVGLGMYFHADLGKK